MAHISRTHASKLIAVTKHFLEIAKKCPKRHNTPKSTQIFLVDANSINFLYPMPEVKSNWKCFRIDNVFFSLFVEPTSTSTPAPMSTTTSTTTTLTTAMTMTTPTTTPTPTSMSMKTQMWSNHFVSLNKRPLLWQQGGRHSKHHFSHKKNIYPQRWTD